LIISAPDGRTVFIADQRSGWMRAISTVARTAGRPIRVKPWPVAMAITLDGKMLYVISATAGMLRPISLAGDHAEPAIRVYGISDSLGWIVVTPDGKILYVLDVGGPSSMVTPIMVATNTAQSPITVGPALAALAITPDGKTLYVADVVGTVTPIAVATDTAGPPVTVAQDPDEIVITPDSKRAYVLSYGGTVTPIVTATNSAGQPTVIADAVDRGMVLAP
jgi:hyaluronoglucosaminidase